MLGLDAAATRHALGIAEYSAPRAPMMRAIAHPTMVKDSSAVAATRELAAAHEITPNQVVDVQVTTFEAAAQLHTTRPKTTEEAQYSLPFAVAAALSHGTLLPETVIEPSKDRETQRLMGLIRVVSSPSMTEEFPSVRRATDTIGLTDGRSWSSGPTTAKGDPEDPLT
jgi:2-methylcitrate dehydratase PrpD